MNPEALYGASAVVAEQLKKARSRRGMTVQELAKRCAEVGAPQLTATMIYNIESGRPDEDGNRRRHVTVDELLILALALNVPPTRLLMPDGQVALQVVPGVNADVRRMVLWCTGVGTPAGLPTVGYEREAAPVRWHQSAYEAERRAKEADSNARWARKDGADDEAEELIRERDGHLRELARIIDSMIEAEMTPPAINPGWARMMTRRGWFRHPDHVRMVDLPDSESEDDGEG